MNCSVEDGFLCQTAYKTVTKFTLANSRDNGSERIRQGEHGYESCYLLALFPICLCPKTVKKAFFKEAYYA